MSRFGRGVRRGRRIARRVMRSRMFRTNFSKSPYYWAGFLVAYSGLASSIGGAGQRLLSISQLVGNSPLRGGLLGMIGAFGRGMMFSNMVQSYMRG